MITKLLLGLTAASTLTLWWMYTSNLQLKNDLQAAVVKQEAAEASLRTAKQEIDLQNAQIENFNKKVLKLEAEAEKAQVQVDKMRDLFQDHDFAKLISKKPGLVENRMIKKTEEVFSEIEAITAD